MASRRSSREKLIETAARLFYERGLPNVGVNEVTRCADVARMTLYNNFESKEALAIGVLERQAELRREMIGAALDRARTPKGEIGAFFVVAERLASEAGFRGCAFINMALQESDPSGRIHAIVRSHKNWLRCTFREIAKRAGVTSPKTLSQQLLALWDGGLVEAYIQQSNAPLKAARAAAESLLAAASASGVE